MIGVNESAAIDMVVTFPANGEGGIGFLELEGLRVPIADDLGSEQVGEIQYPGVPRFAGEERQFTDGDKASVAFGGHGVVSAEFHVSMDKGFYWWRRFARAVLVS